MSVIHTIVHRRGRVAATWELLAEGVAARQLTAAVRSGDIVRARQGHYCCPELSAAEQEALRVGGRLTGTSGARHYGIWSPLLPELEIAVHPDATQLRTRFDATARLSSSRAGAHTAVAWRDDGARGTRTVLLPIECLEQIATTQPAAVAFAATESALHLGHVSAADVRRLIARLPSTRRGALHLARGIAESGGESLFAYQLDLPGISITQQQWIGDLRVDFLLGERLVVEIDGYEFHSTRAAFENDRHRDAVLRALGYRVLRFSYRQVETSWAEVAAAVASAIASGDHLAG